MPTWSGLQIRWPQTGLTLFFTHRCLLDLAYKFYSRKRVLSLFIIHRCLLDRAYKTDSRKRVLPFITWSCARLPIFQILLFHLSLPSTASLVVLLTLSRISTCLGLQLWCQFGWDLKILENFDLFELPFFLPEGLSESFIGCKTLFHFAYLFQIRKHISDAMCHAMYDCAWMKCLSI